MAQNQESLIAGLPDVVPPQPMEDDAQEPAIAPKTPSLAEGLGDFLPGGNEQIQGLPQPPPATWPKDVPYPGKGTPLEHFEPPPSWGTHEEIGNMKQDMPDAESATAMPMPKGGIPLDQVPPRPFDIAPPSTLNHMLDEMPEAKPQIDTPQIRQIMQDMNDINYSWVPAKLDPPEEKRFKNEVRQSAWYKNLVATFDGAPNLNDPGYDYRGAWKSGEAPLAGQQWPTGSANGDKTYLGPSHPYMRRHMVQRVTGHDVSAMPEADLDAMMQGGAMAMLAEQQAKASAQGMVAHHEESETVTEPGTGEGRNVYGRDQGGLAGKPLPFDKERYASPEEAARAAGERSKGMTPEMEGELSEKGKRARAKGREAQWFGGGKTATDAGKGPVRGYGPKGDYTKEEWEYINGTKEPAATAAPATPAVPAAPAPPAAAPATVGQSRKSYMDRRIKEIERGQ